ncbi:MAG: hypothetical protein R2827_03365 [Bdellovibrionales bacterium]
MSNAIVLTGDVNAYLKFLTAGSTLGYVEREIRRATIRASMFLVNQIKNKIRSQKGLRPNTPLTLALSRGSLTLLKEKNLFDALGYTLKNAFESEVGIPQGRKSTGGVTSHPEELQKIVFRLHKGFTIDLTPEVRAALIYGLRKKGGRSAKAAIQGFEQNTGKPKGQIRVKPIKFMSSVFNNTANQEKVRRIYRDGLERAFKSAGAKDGDHRDKA